MYNIEFGKWDKLPHYAVVGNSTCMYMWVNEDGRGSASEWIKGTAAFESYNKMMKLKKADCIDSIKALHKEYTK